MSMSMEHDGQNADDLIAELREQNERLASALRAILDDPGAGAITGCRLAQALAALAQGGAQ